jgi:PleD family two-component response regulator
MTDLAFERAPLVVIANSQEWHTRSLESILGPHGYAVLRAYSGKQAIDRVRTSQPDAIMIDTFLPDMDGLEVCRTLRGDHQLSASTPILMTSTGASGSQKRVAALRAGAWDLLTLPLEGEELPLRLGAYVRAKFDADRAREESLLDQNTGLYNIRGLARRARELGSQAFRDREPLACIVFSPQIDAPEGEDESALLVAVGRLAKVLRDTGRVSDAIGRLGPTEFAVVAHGIGPDGAKGLAERLRRAVTTLNDEGGQRFSMHAGFDAVDNYREAPIEPTDMMARAATAMRQSRTDADGGWIRAFAEARAN